MTAAADPVCFDNPDDCPDSLTECFAREDSRCSVSLYTIRLFDWYVEPLN